MILVGFRQSGCRLVSWPECTIESVLESHGDRASTFGLLMVQIGYWKRNRVTRRERNANRGLWVGAGADVRIVDNDKQSALQYAQLHSRTKVENLLQLYACEYTW